MNLDHKPYLLLFNAITDALRMLEDQNIGQARSILTRAQQTAEELILEQTEEDGP